MEITLRNLDRTNLQEEAFLKLVRKYAHNFKKDIIITFNNRISAYGTYDFDKKDKTHIIKISVKKCCKDKLGFALEPNAQKYHLISTTIHELFHARRQEELGQKRFWGNKYGKRKDIKDPDISDYFSECEVETRVYENKNVIAAVEFYDSCCL